MSAREKGGPHHFSLMYVGLRHSLLSTSTRQAGPIARNAVYWLQIGDLLELQKTSKKW
jgi:hypothetical protein